MIHLNWLMAVLAALAPAGTTIDAPTRMVELGTLGGLFSQASAVNDRGEIVGTSSTSIEGATRAFVWRDGQMTDLGTLGGRFSVATDINNEGDIVGYSQTAGGQFHAFLWRDGRMSDLGTLGGPGGSSVARAINDRGEVVGDNDHSGRYRAFLWRNGQMTALGDEPSRASGINEDGDVVGTSYAGEVLTALLWRDGKASRLHAGYGIAINDRDQVLTVEGYLWRHGRLTAVTAPAGAASVTTLGLNNHGTVVGSTELGAFMSRGARANTLPRGSTDTIAFATDVNDRGQIVGSSGVEEGYMRAVLWTR